jgi:hypothetical protein
MLSKQSNAMQKMTLPKKSLPHIKQIHVFLTTPTLETELDTRYTRNKNRIADTHNKTLTDYLSAQNKSIERFYHTEITCNNNEVLKQYHLNNINRIEQCLVDLKNSPKPAE